MKNSLLALIALTSVFSQANPAHARSRTSCNASVADGIADIAAARERFGLGEVTLVDVNQATMALLDTKLTCNLILIDQYCAEKIPLLETNIAGMQEEVAIGQRSAEDVRKAKIELRITQEICA